MIRCPKCGGDAKTLETREAGRGVDAYARRRRECATCRHRITTYEVIVDATGALGSDFMIVKRAMLEQVVRLIIRPFAARTDGTVVSDLLDRLFNAGASADADRE